jgi:hypothetical protein
VTPDDLYQMLNQITWKLNENYVWIVPKFSPFKLYNRTDKKRPKVVKNAPTLYVHIYQLIKEVCLFVCYVKIFQTMVAFALCIIGKLLMNKDALKWFDNFKLMVY